jgi:hypothetical protein
MFELRISFKACLACGAGVRIKPGASAPGSWFIKITFKPAERATAARFTGCKTICSTTPGAHAPGFTLKPAPQAKNQTRALPPGFTPTPAPQAKSQTRAPPGFTLTPVSQADICLCPRREPNDTSIQASVCKLRLRRRMCGEATPRRHASLMSGLSPEPRA